MNIITYNKLLKSLTKRGENFNQDFNDAVKASVNLYWGEGNQNIGIVNNLLAVASVVKGINRERLVSFYKEVIPHAYNTKGKLFTGKKPDSELTQESALEYNVKNRWYDKKESEPTEFNFKVWESRLIKKALTLTKAQRKQLVADLSNLDEVEQVKAKVQTKAKAVRQVAQA